MLLGVAADACTHTHGRRLTIETRIHGNPTETLTPVVQELHDDPIMGLDIDPSGGLVVTAAGADVRLWELPSGRLRARVDNLDGPIRDLAFFWTDPADEGDFLQLSVLYADDEGLKSWSLETDSIYSIDQELAAFAVGSAGQVAASRRSAVLFSADAHDFSSWSFSDAIYRHLDVAQWIPCVRCPSVGRIVALGEDNRLLIVDPHRNEGYLSYHRWVDPCGASMSDAFPQRVALSNDGRRVAVAMSGRVFAAQIDRLPLLPTWREPELRPLQSACLTAPSVTKPETVRLDVAALQFDYGGDRVSVAGADGSIRAWDLKTGAMTVLVAGAPVTPERAHALAAHSVTRRWLAHASGGEVRVWDLRNNTSVAKFPVVGPRRRLVEVALSTRDRLAVARDDRVEVWNLASGQLECLDTLVGHVAWSPDGSRLAAWEMESRRSTAAPRMIVRSAENLAAAGLALLLADTTFPLPPVAWVNERHLLVPIGPALEIWDVDAGVRLSRVALPQKETVHSLAFGADRVAALKHRGGNDTLFSLSLTDPAQLRATPVLRTSGPVAIAPDGQEIATVHGEAPLVVWDALSLRPNAFYATRVHSLVADVVALSPRGVVRGSHRGMSVSLTTSDQEDAASSIKIRRRPLGLDVSGDGRLLAVAAADGAYVHRLGADGREETRLQLVSDASPGCEGLVIVDGSRIATSERASTPIQVRLGSPLSGPLLLARDLPAARRLDAVPLPDDPRRLVTPAATGVPTLIRAVLRSRDLYVQIASVGDGPVTVCLDVVFEGNQPTVERCYDARTDPSELRSIALPQARITDVWVKACDPARTLCGRAMRAVGPHTAEGRRFGF